MAVGLDMDFGLKIWLTAPVYYKRNKLFNFNKFRFIGSNDKIAGVIPIEKDTP
jgi:hypothetical protein